ncbi:MAG: S8 family serine peptidase [Nanoarchaeota archaeon]
MVVIIKFRFISIFILLVLLISLLITTAIDIEIFSDIINESDEITVTSSTSTTSSTIEKTSTSTSTSTSSTGIIEETEEVVTISEEIRSAKLQSEIINKKGKVRTIIQLKDDKEIISDKIKLKNGKIEDVEDDELIVVEVDDIKDLDEILLETSVEKVWPDRETEIFLDTSVDQINAPSLWDLGYDGEGIKIAILDTGVNKNHPMLDGRVILEQDFTDSNDVNDYNGHGTHVAGIAAGSNELGNYEGVAPKALILNGKILDNNGRGYLSWLINGLDWAIDPDNNFNTDDGADVIVLSLGATYDSEPEELLNSPEVLKVEEAISKGIVVVIASGNCGSGCGSFTGVTTPGISRNAITVGAVNDNNEWLSFSSGDTISDFIKPDVVAPGDNICSSFLGDYNCLTGTSMSTPHVAGASALLLSKDNNLSPLQIKGILENNALDLGDSGKDIKYGSGLIDLSKTEEGIIEEHPTNKNFKLSIPVFDIGKEDRIVLEYFNDKGDPKEIKSRKIKVRFEIEELDELIASEDTENIPPSKSKTFGIKFTPELVGKHLLKVHIYEKDELIDSADVAINVGGVFVDRMANVEVVL